MVAINYVIQFSMFLVVKEVMKRKARVCGNLPCLVVVLMVPGPSLVQSITPSDP